MDDEILALLSRRAEIVRELTQIKLNSGLPLIDWSREAEIIQRALNNSGSLKEVSANRIYRAILREARQMEIDLAQSAENSSVSIAR